MNPEIFCQNFEQPDNFWQIQKSTSKSAGKYPQPIPTAWGRVRGPHCPLVAHPHPAVFAFVSFDPREQWSTLAASGN